MKRQKDVKDYYGGAEGPLGFPMKDELAKRLEGVLAGLPREVRDLLDARGGVLRSQRAAATIELRPEQGVDVSLITTEVLDLDKESLFADGGDWSYWEGNGKQVTFAHDYTSLPIGEGLWVKRDASPAGMEGWKGATQYHAVPEWWDEPEARWFPRVVQHYVMELNLRGKSIGFIPLAMRQPTKKDIEARPWVADAAWVFPKWLGLEWAVAPVQCNPEAVRLDVKRAQTAGLETPERLLKALGVEPEPEPEPEPKPKARAQAVHRVGPPAVEAVTLAEAERLVNGELAKTLGDLPATIEDALDRLRGRV